MNQLENAAGELVWQGQIDVAGEEEQRVRTAIPIAQTIGALEPGLYAQDYMRMHRDTGRDRLQRRNGTARSSESDRSETPLQRPPKHP